jgi:LacI family transcriptional regulator
LQRTDTIGLVVPDTHNPYFSEVARGIEAVAFENGFAVYLCHTGYDVDKELQYINLLHTQRVAGVIWVPGTSSTAPFDQLKQYGVATVVIDRKVPEREVPAIIADNFHGGYIAADHLIRLGHRRIGFISRPMALSHSYGRFEGYRAALSDHGIEFDPALVVATSGFTLQHGYQATQKLLLRAPVPTAIFTYNDIVAISAIRCAVSMGYRVPEDISIVGFDDIDQAEFTCPALTTVHLPKIEMGQMGAKMLIALIEKKEVNPDLLETLPVELIIRESTAKLTG